MKDKSYGRLYWFVFLILFFLSGTSGLVYEVVWNRLLVTVFGSTVYATSTILAAFMGGLSLGSFLFGRRVDKIRNPLALYGFVEVGIALFALAFPYLNQALLLLYGQIYRGLNPEFAIFSIIRFLLVFIVLMVPTCLMGGTLPVLSRHFASRQKLAGKRIGWLYGINTTGAVVGSFAAGFILVELGGLELTTRLAAGLNLFVGLVSLALSRRVRVVQPEAVAAEKPDGEQEAAPVRIDRNLLRLLLVTIGISGLTAIAYEVVWSRALVFLFTTHIYAFSIMLTTFLAGIALGSLFYSVVLDKRIDPLRGFAYMELGIGLLAIVSLPLMAMLPGLNAALESWLKVSSLGSWTAVKFIEAFMIMIGPTLLMGAAFPAVTRVYAENFGRIGRSVGSVYAWNTVGGVIGSLAAGFLLIPTLGIGRTVALMASGNLLIAVFVLTFRQKSKNTVRIRAAVVAFSVLLVAFWPGNILHPLYEFSEPGGEIVYGDEGPAGTVTVHRYPDYKVISIDGANVAGTDLLLRTTQKLQAHIPALLSKSPKKVLQIGFGSGETARVLNLYRPARIDMVEINPDVIATSDRFFADINGGITSSPNFNPIIMDGKNYLLFSPERYDIILNDSIYPGLAGSSSLYTIEHFRACWEHLNPGGVLSSWFPLDLSLDDQRVVARTFQEVFPVSSLWFGHNCRNKHALLVGIKTDAEFRIDGARFQQAMDDPKINQDLAEIGLTDTESLLDCFIMGPRAVRAFARSAPINSDDKPRLEFSKTKFRSIPGSIAAALRVVSPLRENVLDYLTGLDTETGAEIVAGLKLYSQSTPHVLRGLLNDVEGTPGMLTTEFEQALRFNPADANARFFLEFLPGELEAARQATKLNPQDPEKQFDLAYELLKRGEYKEAALAYAAGLIRDEDNIPGLMKLAIAYTLLGPDYIRQAANIYLEILKLDPDNLEVCINLGACLGNGLDRWDDAITYYRRAIRIDPDNSSGYYNLGLAYMEKEQFHIAVVAYRQAIDRGMESPYVFNELGFGLAVLGRDTEAIAAFKKALELDPSFAEAEQNLNHIKNRLP
ncbi:fused MFS/spermidine synthase [candidate division KSB1 bacterium]